MSGVFATMEMEGLDPFLTFLNAVGSPRRQAEGLAHLGGLIESQTRARIGEEKRAPDGAAWPAWSESYAASRHKGQGLLQAEGGLLDFLAWDLTGDELRVGSNLVYAALHQGGGTSDMPPGPAAVPAREFLGLSADNLREIEGALNDWFGSLQ